jgi:hypothetical protein
METALKINGDPFWKIARLVNEKNAFPICGVWTFDIFFEYGENMPWAGSYLFNPIYSF